MSPLLSCRLRRDRRHRRLEIVEAVADELVGLRRDLRRTCWAICLGCVLFEYTVLEQVRDMLKWDVEVEPEAPCWAQQSRSEQGSPYSNSVLAFLQTTLLSTTTLLMISRVDTIKAHISHTTIFW